MRISRSCYNSKLFHVMVQGIGKEKIFKEHKMKKVFMKYAKECAVNSDVDILAYCIMGNHAHILIYSDESIKLTKMMHSLNTRYAQLYNKTFQRCGYVFRDRYRCENIMTVDHLKNCIRYIHLNPVKARLCKSCADYEYSSYNEYRHKKMNTEKLKEIIGEDLSFVINENDEELGIFIDIDNEFASNSKLTLESVIESYCKQRNVLIEKLNAAQLSELINLLVNKYKIKKIDIQKKLQISRYMFWKILKNGEDGDWREL